MEKRVTRKFKRDNTARIKVEETLTMGDMFEQFMLIIISEGLATRTIREYYVNYDYFLRYIDGGDLEKDEMTTELFCGWIAYMLEELELAPATVNIRVRTMRSFVRYCYDDKGWIKEPVHRRFKPVKAPIDNVEAFTPEEVRRLMGSIDDSTYTGFRTKMQRGDGSCVSL